MANERQVGILIIFGLTLSPSMSASGQSDERSSFRETDRTNDSSRIAYDDSTLSRLSPEDSARRLMCDSASLTLERDFRYFRTRPSRQDRSATLEFFVQPPRRSFVVTEDARPDASQDPRRVVVDAAWIAESCEEELVAAQAESELDTSALQDILVSAETIPLEQAVQAASDEENELVCVTEPSLSSRIPRRTCTTQAELDRIAEASREWFRTDGDHGGVVEVNTID